MVHPALTPVRRRQLGLWTRRQAVDCGVAHSTVRRWVLRGRAVELFPGVLVEVGQPVGWEVRALGAQLWAGGDAMLARASAARVLGLRLPARLSTAGLHLVVAVRTPDTPAGVTVHRTGRDLDGIRSHVPPHRTTATAATICDLAAELRPHELRSTVAHAVRTGRTEAVELRRSLELHGRFRGRAALRRILDELSPLEARTRSELESLFLRVTAAHGLAPDDCNVPVVDAAGRHRVLDAAYLPERVPVELDSHREHGTLLDWNDDRRRATDVELTSDWRPFLRFSWDDLTNHAPAVVARIALALRAAGSARPLPAWTTLPRWSSVP